MNRKDLQVLFAIARDKDMMSAPVVDVIREWQEYCMEQDYYDTMLTAFNPFH